MKSMAQLEYHYGLKIRIYPSDYQKQIIKVNSYSRIPIQAMRTLLNQAN